MEAAADPQPSPLTLPPEDQAWVKTRQAMPDKEWLDKCVAFRPFEKPGSPADIERSVRWFLASVGVAQRKVDVVSSLADALWSIESRIREAMWRLADERLQRIDDYGGMPPQDVARQASVEAYDRGAEDTEFREKLVRAFGLMSLWTVQRHVAHDTAVRRMDALWSWLDRANQLQYPLARQKFKSTGTRNGEKAVVFGSIWCPLDFLRFVSNAPEPMDKPVVPLHDIQRSLSWMWMSGVTGIHIAADVVTVIPDPVVAFAAPPPPPRPVLDADSRSRAIPASNPPVHHWGDVPGEVHIGDAFGAIADRVGPTPQPVQLHSLEGPSVRWPKQKLFALWGRPIPEAQYDKLTSGIETAARVFMEERNQEVRAVFRRYCDERYGQHSIFLAQGAEKAKTDTYGTMWVIKTPPPELSQEAVVLVEVENKTDEPDGSRKRYFLRVPPSFADGKPQDALAWTFRLEGQRAKDYAPAKET